MTGWTGRTGWTGTGVVSCWLPTTRYGLVAVECEFVVDDSENKASSTNNELKKMTAKHATAESVLCEAQHLSTRPCDFGAAYPVSLASCKRERGAPISARLSTSDLI